MLKRGYLGVGPLSAAAGVLVDTPPPPLPPGDPAAFLARQMDLRGAVDLSQRLGSLSRSSAAPPSFPASLPRLRALVADRLAEIRATVDRAFSDPFQRRNKLPDAAAMFSTLEQAGAFGVTSGRPFAVARDAIQAPFGELVSRWIDRVLAETRSLRAELGPALQVLGPAAARLERLDTALLGATERGRAAIVQKLLPALAASFARALSKAVLALPERPTPADLAPWIDRGGWVRVEIDRGRAVVLAVLAHESGRLEALVGDARRDEAPG